MSTTGRTFETSTSTLGLTTARTLLAPTTALYTLPFGLYYILLSHRVIRERKASCRSLGTGKPPACCSTSTGGCPKTTSPTSSASASDVDPLFLANRAHANFCENVPMALILAALAELNGGDRKIIGGSLAVLLAFRVAHVECGMKCRGGMGPGRAVGYFGTQAWLAAMAGYCALLVKDYVGCCV